MTSPWTYLANNGPSPPEDLPYEPNPSQRRDGIRKFQLPGGHGKAKVLKGRPSCIYYIEGKHDPQTVLEAYYGLNPRVRKELDKRTLHMKTATLGDGFKEASRELLGPFESFAKGHGDGGLSDWECPLCGETIQANRRAGHLTGHA